MLLLFFWVRVIKKGWGWNEATYGEWCVSKYCCHVYAFPPPCPNLHTQHQEFDSKRFVNKISKRDAENLSSIQSSNEDNYLAFDPFHSILHFQTQVSFSTFFKSLLLFLVLPSIQYLFVRVRLGFTFQFDTLRATLSWSVSCFCDL